MKKLVTVALLFTGGTILLLCCLSQGVESRHFETSDTIVIEALQLSEHSGDGPPLVEGQRKFPHLVSLIKEGTQVCSGSLINANHVLTTGNCNKFAINLQNITSEEISKLQVGIGYQSFTDETPVELREKEGPYYLRRVMKVIMDRSFYYQSLMTVRNSLVILKLDAPMTYNDYVEAVHLSDNNTLAKLRTSPLKSGKLCGWRKSKEATGKEITFLRGATLRIHPYEECQKEYLNSKKMDDVICASNAGVNPCYFELGSPLTARRGGKNILIGVRERDCHFPNIFTRIDYFLPWIRKNLVH